MKLGIIGYGRIGKLICKYLAQDFDVVIFDNSEDTIPPNEKNSRFSSLEDVCNSDIIIPAVPISQFEKVIIEIKNLIKPGTMIVDVCSVKEHPVEVMKIHLSEEIHILGTHPMFGPDSAADTLFGSKIVLTPVRIPDDKYQSIKTYLNKHGIRIIETTPADHDEQISSSLLLAHLLGRTLIDFGAKDLIIDTKGYRRMMKILETVENDTWQLFDDMNKFNKYSKTTRDSFHSALKQILQRLDQ
jgi:prephenate dehydrogenase